MRTLIAAVITTTLLALPGSADARPQARNCSGYINDSRGAPIGVSIRRGSTSCATAKRVLRTYLNSERPCEGSACVREHSGWTCASASWAARPRVASCSRGRRLIAAYAIAD